MYQGCLFRACWMQLPLSIHDPGSLLGCLATRSPCFIFKLDDQIFLINNAYRSDGDLVGTLWNPMFVSLFKNTDIMCMANRLANGHMQT